MYIHFFNSILMRPPHLYERGYAYGVTNHSNFIYPCPHIAKFTVLKPPIMS